MFKVLKKISQSLIDGAKSQSDDFDNNCKDICQQESENNNTLNQALNFWTLHNELSNKSNTINKEPRDEMPTELKYYLSQPLISRDENPIAYWNKQPPSLLTKLAYRSLTVIATSVPSEMLFSQASLILNDKRSQLSESHF